MHYTVSLYFILSSLILTAGCNTPSRSSSVKIRGGEAVTDTTDPVFQGTVLLLALQGGTCSGTVISSDFILSAAHCAKAFLPLFDKGVLVYKGLPSEVPPIAVVSSIAYPRSYDDAVNAVIKTGAAKWASENPGKSKRYNDLNAKMASKTISSSEQIEFNSLKNAMFDVVNLSPGIPYNDIALFKLSRPLGSDAFIVPMADRTDDIVKGSAVVVAGYGKTGRSNSKTTTRNRLFKFSTNLASVDSTQMQITIEDSTSVSTCHGDSGGPLFLQSGNKLTVLGALSRLRSSPDCGTNGTFTDLRFYRDWVDCQMNFARTGDSSCQLDPSDTIYINGAILQQ